MNDIECLKRARKAIHEPDIDKRMEAVLVLLEDWTKVKVTAALDAKDATITALEARLEIAKSALEVAIRKCEDIEGDPAFNESAEKIRQQDIEWAGEVIKTARTALAKLAAR